ncbi:MAG: DUF1189 family protein [Anaerolineales bacterium]
MTENGDTQGEHKPVEPSGSEPRDDTTRDAGQGKTGEYLVEITGSESDGGLMDPDVDASAIRDDGGIVDDLTWLGRGFFQPLYDLKFYRAAARKSLIDAILFFVVFGTLLTIISTFNLSRNLSLVSDQINQTFASGEFPEIAIENGLATVRARQPLILLEGDGTIVILDTTGAYQGIDTGRYLQGILLTRNSLHFYSSGDYQVMQLSDLNSAFGNPILINRQTALEFWKSFTSTFSVVAFIGLGLWNLLVRLLWLLFLAVLVSGVLSAFNIRSDYSSVLTVGIYALVPAVYISFLLGLIGISFCGFQSGLLVAIWIVVARLVLKPSDSLAQPRQV